MEGGLYDLTAASDLEAFYGWSGLRRLLPLTHPFFEEWNEEMHSSFSPDTQQVKLIAASSELHG